MVGEQAVTGMPFCRIDMDGDEFLLEVGFPVARADRADRSRRAVAAAGRRDGHRHERRTVRQRPAGVLRDRAVDVGQRLQCGRTPVGVVPRRARGAAAAHPRVLALQPPDAATPDPPYGRNRRSRATTVAGMQWHRGAIVHLSGSPDLAGAADALRLPPRRRTAGRRRRHDRVVGRLGRAPGRGRAGHRPPRRVPAARASSTPTCTSRRSTASTASAAASCCPGSSGSSSRPRPGWRTPSTRGRAPRLFCSRLVAAGTTTSMVFGSQFPVAQEALVERVEEVGPAHGAGPDRHDRRARPRPRAAGDHRGASRSSWCATRSSGGIRRRTRAATVRGCRSPSCRGSPSASRPRRSPRWGSCGTSTGTAASTSRRTSARTAGPRAARWREVRARLRRRGLPRRVRRAVPAGLARRRAHAAGPADRARACRALLGRRVRADGRGRHVRRALPGLAAVPRLGHPAVAPGRRGRDDDRDRQRHRRRRRVVHAEGPERLLQGAHERAGRRRRRAVTRPSCCSSARWRAPGPSTSRTASATSTPARTPTSS